MIRRIACCGAALLLLLAAADRRLGAQGIVLNGVGPVNRAMQGASTAAPIDAAGALYWNPASISGLAGNEATFGMELLLPTEEISSSVAGLGSGSDRGEPGVAPIPVVGWVQHYADSRWSVGLGMYGVGGYRVNYAPSADNPILTPPSALNPLSLGRVFGELEVFQIAPTASYAITDGLSIGVAPTLDLAKLGACPLFLAPPGDENGDSLFTYPSGVGTRYHWGGGVQLGLYCVSESGWAWGASIKSPQWFEKFRFMTADELGNSKLVKLDIDYPMIVSLGASYRGFENWLIACDVRYFDYKNTDGFRTAGFGADMHGTGLGWKSIVAVSTGVQYRLSDRLFVRCGYGYQQNPISSANTVFNVASPLIIQHLASVGFSWRLCRHVAVNAAYVHGFRARNSGPFRAPVPGNPGDSTPVPGTSVASEISADALDLGLTIQY